MTQLVHYRNFDLQLSRVKGKLYVEALRTPLRKASKRHALVLPEELEKWRDVVKLSEASDDRLVDLGVKLFRALFPGEIGRLWEGSVKNLSEESLLRIRLDIGDYALALIPWEIIHDGEFHLAMYMQRSLVRTVFGKRSVKPLSKKPPLKILLVVSQPHDASPLSAPARESQLIIKRLQPLVDEQLLAPPQLLHPPTLKSLQEALIDDYDILHFIGHGQFQDDAGFLLFENEEGETDAIDGRKLRYFLHDTRLRLVLLNACVTATPAEKNPSMGVAWSALQAGIPAVVAMQGPIRDEAGAEFAEFFYHMLAKNFPLERCVEEARKALLRFSYADRPEWAVPVLFSNSASGMLWDITASNGKPQAAPLTLIKETKETSTAASAPVQGCQIPHNLAGTDYAAFVNRHAELEKIMKALDPQKRTGVVEITGIGGTGRATLAHEAAARCLEFSCRMPSDPSAFRGIIKLDARHTPLDTPAAEGQQTTVSHWGIDDLCFTVARKLNRMELKQASPDERIVLLRDILSEGRYLLLLCDVDAVGDARLIEFLRAMPLPSKALVTSLAPIIPSGAQRIPLLSLNLADAVELLKQEAEAANVPQIEQASQAELETLATNADRLPLILRWSLIRLRESGQPVAWINKLLAEAGHDTLAEDSLLELLEMLEDQHQMMLLTLALVPAPLTEELAISAARSSLEEARRTLARLEELRLIWRDPDSGRYQMLSLTRRIVLRELPKLTRAEEKQRQTDRSANFTLPNEMRRDLLTYKAYDALLAFTEASGQRDLQAIDAQIRNIMWAVDKAFESQDWPRVLRFRKALEEPFYLLGYWNEAVQTGLLAYEAAKAQAAEAPDDDSKKDEVAWRALYPVAQMHLYQGRYEEAERWCRIALEIFGRRESRSLSEGAPKDTSKDYELAATERLLGRVMMAEGKLDEAGKLFVSAFRRTRKYRRNDRQLNQLGDVVASLAGLAERRGQWKEARRGYEWALRMFQRRKEPNPLALSAMFHRLGSVELGEKHYDEARALFRKSLAEIGDEPNFSRRAKVHYSWALLEEELGRHEEAKRLLETARREFQEHSAIPSEVARIEAALVRVEAALSSRTNSTEGA